MKQYPGQSIASVYDYYSGMFIIFKILNSQTLVVTNNRNFQDLDAFTIKVSSKNGKGWTQFTERCESSNRVTSLQYMNIYSDLYDCELWTITTQDDQRRVNTLQHGKCKTVLIIYLD